MNRGVTRRTVVLVGSSLAAAACGATAPAPPQDVRSVPSPPASASATGPQPNLPAAPATATTATTAATGALKGVKSVDDLLTLDRVHVIAVTVDPARLHLLDDDRSAKVSCDISLDGETYAGATIKEKGSIGSSSTLAEKPGFTVTFAAARPDGVDKLTLNNARQDASFLHEHLAYEIYRRAGVAAPRTAHAALSLNGRPYGIYVIYESADAPFLERTFGKNNARGNFYSGQPKGDFLEVPTDPKILELTDEDKGRKRDDLIALATAAKMPDDQFAAAVSKRLDLDRFITTYAVDSVLAAWDGPMFNNNNFYLYHNPGDDRFVLIPHGQDQVFDLTFDPLQPPKLSLARRIRAVPALDAQYRAALNRVMEEAWDLAKIMARMDRVREVLHAVSAPDAAVGRDVATFDQTFESMRVQVIGRRETWKPV